MHPLSFEFKQCHLSAMRLTRKETDVVGLTPARLDMLRAILERCERVAQSQLRRMLGVCNSVVSIMVRALERRGFVRRERHREDKRTFMVSLTRTARYALRRVYYGAITEGFLELALISAFAKDHMPRAGWEVILWRLDHRLRMFRLAFGIGWTNYNPWDGTDDDHPFYYANVIQNPVTLDLAPEVHDVIPGEIIDEGPETDDADRDQWGSVIVDER